MAPASQSPFILSLSKDAANAARGLGCWLRTATVQESEGL